MRWLAIFLLVAVLLLPAGLAPLAAEPVGRLAALTPGINFGPPARLATAQEHAAMQPADDEGMEPGLQRVLIGTALLGGAFAIGFLASGSLPTAIGAAGAVALSYAVLP